MKASVVFYICPTCFYTSDILDDSHEHALLRVDPGLPGDERRRPITDQNGHIISPAPHWFHEEIMEARAASPNS